MMGVVWVTVMAAILSVNADNMADVNFVTDFLKTRDFSKITAILCWNTENKVILSKHVHSLNKMIGFVNANALKFNNNGEELNILYLYDWGCRYKYILNTASETGLFSSPKQWLILSSHPQTIDEIKQNFTHLNFMADSRITLAQKHENTFALHDLYKINQHNLITSNEGTWSPNNSEIIKPRIISRERSNLNKTTINATMVLINNDTLNHLTDFRDKHVDSVTKETYQLVEYLIEMMNGTSEYRYTNTWGYRMPNSTKFDGIIGDLQSNISEIAGTTMFMTTERLHLIDYTSLTTHTIAIFILRQPPLSYVTNVFTLPFDLGVWVSSFLLIILTTAILYIAVTFDAKSNPTPPTDKELEDNLMEVVMVTIGGLCQQGSDREPRTSSGKIVMIFSFIALMFVYTSYSASIVALLQATATNIDSLNDLLEYRINVGAEDVIYNHYYLANEKEPIRKELYDKKIAPKGQKSNFMTLDNGIKRVRAGYFAFHTEESVAYKVISDTFHEHEKCGLARIGFMQNLMPRLTHRKNSPYKEMIRVGGVILEERGIQSRIHQRVYTGKPKCHTGGNSFVSVGLMESYFAFALLLSGYLFSFILFIVEIITRRAKK